MIPHLFRNRDFALYWGGATVSLLGDGVYFVAIAWQVYALSNKPSALAVVGIAWTLPQLASVLFAGAISDRFERRRVMIGANLASGVVIGTIAALSLAGSLRLWELWILVAVYGVAVALFIPASSAFVPEIVPPDQLVEANALRQFIRPFALRLAGPALGGALVALLGLGEAFLLDSLSFFVSVVLFNLIRRSAAERARPEETSFSEEVLDGLRFIRSASWLWISLTAAAAWLLLYVGPLEVLLPYLVKNKIGAGARGLGFVFAAGGLGAMAFSYVVTRTGVPRRALVFMYAAWSLCTFALGMFGLAGSLWQAMLASFAFFGLANTGEIVWQTTLQRRVPNELLGRVASVDWLVSAGLVPISFLITAPIAGSVGADTTMLGAGIVGGVLLAAVIALPPMWAVAVDQVKDVGRLAAT
jgi:DHA3 family tetracycline resistance protein-like MFS transporter